MLILALVLQVSAIAPASSLPVVKLPAVLQCRVVDALPKKAAVGGAGLLIAGCGKQATPLGPADRFSSVANPLTGRVLLVRERASKTQVFLISPTSDGVAVDDITRDLARAAGRFADLGIRSLSVDTSRFVLDGSVGITSAKGLRWLDLDPYAQRASKVVSAVTAQLPVLNGK